MNVSDRVGIKKEGLSLTYRKRWENLSLRSKFILLLIVVVAGFDLAFIALWQPRANQFIVDLQSREVRNELATAGEGMLPFLFQNQIAAIHETLDVIMGRHPNWVALDFKDADGNRIYPINLPTIDATSLVHLEEQVFFRGEVAASMVVAVDFSQEQAELRKYGYSMVAIATGIFAFAMLAVAVFFEVLIGRRAAGLSKAAEAMADGDFEAELPKASGDEIGQLIHGFARMRKNVYDTQISLSEAREEAESATLAKSQFLAVMSHEIRTPLNGLLGTMQLLEATKLTKRQSRFLQTMGTSGDLLLHHVNDVLDLSRLDAGKGKIISVQFDPNNLIDEVIESMWGVAKNRGNELRNTTQKATELVWGDSIKIRQVLFNLISNASKFTKNGKILIEFVPSSPTHFASISVTDTGIGIAEKYLGRVFSDFEQLDTSHIRGAGGTGLGLSISKRIVEAMRGRISVDSTPEIGSTFSFSWDSAEVPANTQPLADEIQPLQIDDGKCTTPQVSLNILVVEDNRINRFVLHEMLKNEGHNVTEAENGKVGVEIATANRFDLIFMDISMPEFDGMEATTAIRNSLQASFDSPIVALTAHALPQDIEKFKSAGMNEVLTKPISRALLQEVLQSIARKQDTECLSGDLERPADIPFLDLECLDEFVSSIGQEKAVEFAKSFVSDTESGIESLLNPEVEKMELEDISKIAHKLSGSAALFGAVRFRAGLIDVESHANDCDSKNLKSAILELMGLWAQTKNRLYVHFDL